MKPLLVLIVSFLISIFIIRVAKKEFDFKLSAKIAMSIMLCFTAVAHFVFTKGMTAMLPMFVPYKIVIVYLTGILEMVLGFGLLIPKFSTISGWLLIVLLVVMLPANIYASVNQINYQTGQLNGQGLPYLWFRIPLQFFFIVWIYFSTIRR